MPLMYLAGWAASVGALSALVLTIRLIRHGGGGPAPLPRPPGLFDDDYGLLRSVAAIGDLAMAKDVRDRLRYNGVRATVATGGDGMVRVLVFDDELDRARRLINF